VSFYTGAALTYERIIIPLLYHTTRSGGVCNFNLTRYQSVAPAIQHRGLIRARIRR